MSVNYCGKHDAYHILGGTCRYCDLEKEIFEDVISPSQVRNLRALLDSMEMERDGAIATAEHRTTKLMATERFCESLLLTKTAYDDALRWRMGPAVRLFFLAWSLAMCGAIYYQYREIQWWRCQPSYTPPGHPTPVDDETWPPIKEIDLHESAAIA